MHTVLVLGGYGNFGSYICRALAKDENIRLLIGGRSLEKAQRFAAEVGLPERRGQYVDAEVTTLASELRGQGVHTVIHAAGPFQGQDYRVAQACIEAGCNYIDLADARDFVAGISALDYAARTAEVLVVSGASTLPALSSAVVDMLKPEFRRIDTIRLGIASGAKTPGLATVRAVLGYCGKPFTQLQDGRRQGVYGWQDLHLRRYPSPIGRRWLGNCDVPDLALFPQRYPDVKNLSFQAGLGLPFAHLAVWGMSWLVRRGLVESVQPWAKPLHWLGRLVEPLGTRHSAMHVEVSGLGLGGQPLVRTWHILAGNHHGPHIPCGAALALVKKLARGEALPKGAMPCMGLVTLDEYLAELQGLEIRLMHS